MRFVFMIYSLLSSEPRRHKITNNSSFVIRLRCEWLQKQDQNKNHQVEIGFFLSSFSSRFSWQFVRGISFVYSLCDAIFIFVLSITILIPLCVFVCVCLLSVKRFGRLKRCENLWKDIVIAYSHHAVFLSFALSVSRIRTCCSLAAMFGSTLPLIVYIYLLVKTCLLPVFAQPL